MNALRDQVFAVSDLIGAHERHLRAAGRARKTITARVRLLNALHDELPFGLAYASTEELEDWLGRRVWSAWTRRTYANHIRGFYAWAEGLWLAGNPAADMAKQRKPDAAPNPVSDDELAGALERSPEPWHTAITLAAFGGLRLAELAGVHREDVTETRIHIRKAKGGDGASIDTHPLIWEQIQERPPGPLLVRVSGKPAPARWFSDNERAFFDSIDLPGVHLHRFRHWFATSLLNATGDLRVVQEALRHKNVSSTQGYTKVAGGQRRLAIRSLPTPTQHPEEH
jgi:integrase/recombinase XerD